VIDWKISISAIFVALLGIWIGHRLTTSRSEGENYRNKVREFKELLVPFLRELESQDAHPATLVSQHFPEHDEAARKLMVHMPKRKQQKFASQWQKYSDLYTEKQAQGILSMIGTEVDDIEKASPGAPGSSDYIYQQNAKRRDRVRQVVRDALDVL
jgi:hypothetical protein